MDGKIMKQGELLGKIFLMMVAKEVWKDEDPKEFIPLLLYLHKKGWLYTSVNGDEVRISVAMYRIPEVKDEYTNTLPKEESGDILFIPFFASNHTDRLAPLRMLKGHIRRQDGINRVAFYERGNKDKLRIYTIRKEVRNEQ